MEIYLAEMEPIRESEDIQMSFIMMVVSAAEISEMAKNGGNSLGLMETDGALLGELCGFDGQCCAHH